MAFFSVNMHRVSKALLVFIAAISLPAVGGECRSRVFLTFDPGNMDHAEFIAHTLKQNHIRATFFLANTATRRGDHALDESWKEFWQARVAEGHVFGNHTWSHYYARQDLPKQKLRAVDANGKDVILDSTQYCHELTRVADRFQLLTGSRLRSLWRAPGGKTTAQSLRWANDCGYPIHVGWDPAGYIGDDRPVALGSNQQLLGRALASIKSGDIILMHLGIWSRSTPLAPVLPQLISGLQQRGFCFDVLHGGVRE